jgi:L-rhamnose mutarotase
MKRYGQVIKIHPEMVEKYKELHANVWPSVAKQITECNIKNYSIFMRDGYLFAYFEYVGEDFEADMAKMAQDKATQDWWAETNPCQQPVDSAGEGIWWAGMEEVFHQD